MPSEIVKVQRPITSTEAGAPWLIYDKARKRVEQKPSATIGNDVRKAMGADYKAFFQGTWSAKGVWELSDRVDDQSW